MRRLDFGGAFEVGDGAADFEDAAVGAGAEPQFIDRDFEKFLRFRLHAAIAPDVSRAHLRIGVEASFLKARELNRTGSVDSLTND